MDMSRLPIILLSSSLPLIASAEPTLAHSAGASLSAAEIASAFKGKVCSTKGGAKFSFGTDGTYLYDGVWQSNGSYVIGPDYITVTFANGLRRSFAITVRDGTFYMEQTAISCATGG